MQQLQDKKRHSKISNKMALAWSKLKKIEKTMNQHVSASLIDDFIEKTWQLQHPKRP